MRDFARACAYRPLTVLPPWPRSLRLLKTSRSWSVVRKLRSPPSLNFRSSMPSRPWRGSGLAPSALFAQRWRQRWWGTTSGSQIGAEGVPIHTRKGQNNQEGKNCFGSGSRLRWHAECAKGCCPPAKGWAVLAPTAERGVRREELRVLAWPTPSSGAAAALARQPLLQSTRCSNGESLWFLIREWL